MWYICCDYYSENNVINVCHEAFLQQILIPKNGDDDLYKVIMIDDEELALKSISKAVNWEDYGLELTAVFSDPDIAMKYIYTHHVDGIFTDIKMPKITGLEISKRVKNDFPDVAVFLISAYSEFEYAYEAIENGVEGYILKPINFKRLVEACCKMRDILDKRSESHWLCFENKCSEELQNLVSSYINRKVDNIDKIEQCLKKEKYDVDINNAPCAKISVVMIDLLEYLSETWTHGKKRLYFALRQLMESNELYLIPYLNYFDCMEFLVLSKVSDYEEFTKNLDDFKNIYTANCFENLNLEVSVSTIKIFGSLRDINKKGSDIRCECQSIYNCIETGDDEAVGKMLKNFLDENGQNELLELSEFLVLEFNNETNDKISYNEVSEKGLQELVKKMINYFSARGNITKSILNAKKYIDSHYNEHLSLDDVASKAYLSVSQFTRLFKKEYNVSFINYLNKVRIDKACELLINTDYSANVICGMVGYTSYSYFRKKFVQYKKCSPIEYRTTNLKK